MVKLHTSFPTTEGFDKVGARLGLLFSCRGFSMTVLERPGMARVDQKFGVKLHP